METEVTQYVVLSVSGRTLLQHRFVMEQVLGRELLRSEHIHHINGDKRDNRIENLRIVTQKEHNGIHRVRALPAGRWSVMYEACIDCGTTTRRHISRGRCSACNSKVKRDAKRGGPPAPRSVSCNAGLPPGRWARKHDSCVACGTTSNRHMSHGLCVPCYWKWSWAVRGRRVTTPLSQFVPDGVEVR